MRIAARAAEQALSEVTVIDLRDYPLPNFDEDLEKIGTPQNARKLKELFVPKHQGLLIASPEYNSSIPALLKNTLHPEEFPSRSWRVTNLGSLRQSCQPDEHIAGRFGRFAWSRASAVNPGATSE